MALQYIEAVSPGELQNLRARGQVADAHCASIICTGFMDLEIGCRHQVIQVPSDPLVVATTAPLPLA